MKFITGFFGFLALFIGVAGLPCALVFVSNGNNDVRMAIATGILGVLMFIGGWILMLDSRKKPLNIAKVVFVICFVIAAVGVVNHENYDGYAVMTILCILFCPISILMAFIKSRKSKGNERSPYTKNFSPVITIGNERFDLYKETLSLPIGGKRGYIAQFYDDIEVLGIWTPATWTKAPQLIPISYNQIRGCKLNRKRNRDYILGDKVSQLYAVLTVEGVYGPSLYVDFMPLQSKPPKENSRAYARCLTDADRFVSKVQLVQSMRHKYNR